MPENACSRNAFGVVAIGRNEGERLSQCLRSVAQLTSLVVYVDSGSTDGSVELARNLGASVLALDLSTPFTAGRARNAGFRRVRELAPTLRHVQFVDGDCEVAQGWLNKAAQFLDANPDIAVVCGRCRERFPGHSVYNMLCDIEWDTPVGEAKACGGIAMIRVDAFESVKGFSADLIAGEEPELCVRLRAAGWRIWRMAEEMTLHDAAMQHFGQWWRRTLRGGYAFAQGADMHGAPPERHWVRESRSAWFWGMGIPLTVLAVVIGWNAWGLSLLAIYPLQIIRLALREGRRSRENWWRATFLVLGKFPEMLGQVKFMLHRYVGGQPRLIEYK
jgi:GT2 family glycosyltransferase